MNKTILSAVLTLLLALTSILPAGAAEALIPVSTFEDDGVVRVYLQSLGMPETLTLIMDGEYTLEHSAGFRFERGAQIVLRSDEDRIWLCVGGLMLDMGPTLTLTRQKSASAQNGLKIAESGRDTLYSGDLTLTLQNGRLRPVLAIDVEAYLCGVIAYEMSDSWPLEALKAQAVAARTYVMQRKQISQTRDYDVVDTTADQVFKGIDPEFTRVAQAVEATEGVVGMWRGNFAVCYYTASNGGETALPSDVWKIDGDFGYLERRSDPYDLENPNSLLASVHFSRNAEDLPALQAMLQAALADAALQRGWAAEDVMLEEILSVEPAAPIEAGSLMCSKLRFTLSVCVPAENAAIEESASDDEKDPSPFEHLLELVIGDPDAASHALQPLDEPVVVELDVYDQIKDVLGLALNSGDYEVLSVSEDKNGFTLEMRRFGHGVGMSQRGAQRMAGAHKKNWREILTFYYPNMYLEKIVWQRPELVSIEELPLDAGSARPYPTPTPTPIPLPALNEGEYYATVTLDDAGSNLNLRQYPTTQSPVAALLNDGQRVIVSGEADAQGWVHIRTAELSGYAKLEYLSAE